MTTRRAVLLATASGWVTAMTPPPRPVSGAVIAARHELGHLLRDGGWQELPEGPPRTVDVVIVGGGVSGLSTAWRLAPLGLNVLLCELEPELGGTSVAGYDGVVPHPFGAHYLPAPNVEARATLRLLSELGLIEGWDPLGHPIYDRRTLCHEPDERLFFRGAWHRGLAPREALSAAEQAELERFLASAAEASQARGSDGRHRFQIPVLESSADPEALALDALSMASWLDREGYVTPFVRWFVRYATLDDFGAEPEHVSAWAGLHYFSARKQKGEDGETPYLVWPEGNGRLVRALEERSDAERATGTLAVSLERTRDGVRLHCVDAGRRMRFRVDARGAVLATPGFIATRIAPSLTSAPPIRQSSPWLVANLHLERPIDPDMAWDSVLYDGAGLGYVDASHQLTPPRERTVWTYYRAYGDGDPAGTRRRLATRRWDELCADVLGDLAAAHPELRDQTSRMDLAVWGHAMPRPEPGFLQRSFAAPIALDERVTFGHVDRAGIALFEEAQRAGVLAAEELARRIGKDPGPTWG